MPLVASYPRTPRRQHRGGASPMPWRDHTSLPLRLPPSVTLHFCSTPVSRATLPPFGIRALLMPPPPVHRETLPALGFHARHPSPSPFRIRSASASKQPRNPPSARDPRLPSVSAPPARYASLHSRLRSHFAMVALWHHTAQALPFTSLHAPPCLQVSFQSPSLPPTSVIMSVGNDLHHSNRPSRHHPCLVPFSVIHRRAKRNAPLRVSVSTFRLTCNPPSARDARRTSVSTSNTTAECSRRTPLFREDRRSHCHGGRAPLHTARGRVV